MTLLHRPLLKALLPLALLCLGLGGASSRAADNPYAKPAAGDRAIDALVRRSQFGEPGANSALALWLARNPGAPRDQLGAGYHQLCKVYGVRTLHALRAAACATEARLKPDGEHSEIAAALKETPPVRAIGAARLPLSRNALGSETIDATVNGVTLPWMVDTGAQIAVLPQSNADRLGVRYVGADFKVGTPTAAVHGAVGVIDLMMIGDAVVENVPVLVLPDAQLSVGGIATIPAILSLPVFNAFRRMAWLDGGATLALGEAAPAPADRRYRIYWHEDGVGAPLSTALGVQGGHLDTGANLTDLRGPGLALLSPAEQASGKAHEATTGGAGGVITTQDLHFPRLSMALAGAPIALTDVALDTRSTDDAGRIGMDAVLQMQTLVLDFEHMTILATPRTPAPSP